MSQIGIRIPEEDVGLLRIAYGIHGYGRGHAMRARAVLPELCERHEVLVLAGGDAFEALRHDFSVQRIPALAFHYRRPGVISNWQTARRNLSAVLDLWFRGPALEMVIAAIRDFKADLILSDSEGFTHRAGQRMHIPRIGFDHFGLLVYFRPAMSWRDRLACRVNAGAYRALFGEPDRVVVSSFFPADPIRPGACIVGPVIRDAARSMRPVRGDHLLVYLSQGENEYTPRIEKALLDCGSPVRVYGTRRRGLHENLQFKPISDIPFLEDLAGCRAVLATTGNQLLGEVLHFRKPILGMPIHCLEQRLNAAQITRLGIGMVTSRRRLCGNLIREFLSHEEKFLAHFPACQADGTAEAVEAIERFAAELTAGNTRPMVDAPK